MLKITSPPNTFFLDLEEKKSQRLFMIRFHFSCELVVSQLSFLGDKTEAPIISLIFLTHSKSFYLCYSVNDKPSFIPKLL